MREIPAIIDIDCFYENPAPRVRAIGGGASSMILLLLTRIDHVTVPERDRSTELGGWCQQHLARHQPGIRSSHASAKPLQDASGYRQVQRQDHARRHGSL